MNPEDKYEEAETEPSIYDRETEEADLWFVPPDEPAETGAGEGACLLRAADWEAAESRCARPLADAASALARLDERLASLAEPGRHAQRLAIGEVAGLSWAEGQRLSEERIALYAALRLSATDADARDLSLADWARRRLLGGPAPDDTAAFLGRSHSEPGTGEGAERGDLIPRPLGEEFAALAHRWREEIARGDLHPITRACQAWHLWRQLGLSGPEAVIEPAVAAARIGARGLCALSFMPIAFATGRALTGPRHHGPPAQRLKPWLRSVTEAATNARATLERVTAWEARARAATADMKGRTPRALIEALAALPVLSAPAAEHLTKASRAAVQRNLARLTTRGLAREITGQTRYRFWKAMI